MLPLIIILITSHLLPLISTLPSGAPTSACNTLTPIHGGLFAQQTTSPYRIRPYTSRVGQGQTLGLIIEATPSNLGFGGFMIHAVVANNPNQVLGRFEQTDSIRLIECAGANDTATHRNSLTKTNLEFEWTAPRDFAGEVFFK